MSESVAQFVVGQRVVVRGLSCSTHLNGKIGKILRFDEPTGRYAVDFGLGDGGKLVKPVNLERERDIHELEEVVVKKRKHFKDEITKAILNFPNRSNALFKCTLDKYDRSTDLTVFEFQCLPESQSSFNFKMIVRILKAAPIFNSQFFRIEMKCICDVDGINSRHAKQFVAETWNRERMIPKMHVDSEGCFIMSQYFSLGEMVAESLSEHVNYNVTEMTHVCHIAIMFLIGKRNVELPFATVEMIEHCSILFSASERHTKEKCPICLQYFEIGDKLRRLPCLHVFHAKEVDKHLSEKKWCPECKVPIDIDVDKHIHSEADLGCTS